MQAKNFSQHSLIEFGAFKSGDSSKINQCRGKHNKLGYAYQLIFVKLLNHFPKLVPFEVIDEITTYAALQLSIDSNEINRYQNNIAKISAHRKGITAYLKLQLFDSVAQTKLENFIFEIALRLESHSLLNTQAIIFLRTNNILSPTVDTLNRLVSSQRKSARQHIFDTTYAKIPVSTIEAINKLLVSQDNNSKLELLKRPPPMASADSIMNLYERLNIIKDTGILNIDLRHINNNYQKIFTREIRVYSVGRIRSLTSPRRYTAIACFLHQSYQDTTDFFIDSFIKLLNRSYNRSKAKVEAQIRQNEEDIRKSLKTYQELKAVIKDENIPDIKLRPVIYQRFANEFSNNKQIDIMLKSKSSCIFELIVNKFSYYRQFSPEVIATLDLQSEGQHESAVIDAVTALKDLNANNKRKLGADTPLRFIPKNLQKDIITGDQIDRHAWECALLFAIKDEIKNSNISIKNSKRFCQFQNLFMPEEKWFEVRSSFFAKTRLAQNRDDAMAYLTKRLNNAYEQYEKYAEYNSYAKVIDGEFVLSRDQAEEPTDKQKEELQALKNWLASCMRTIKLPDLLVEVDNELNFISAFMLPNRKHQLMIDDICAIIATIMAHGCNVGLDCMSQLVTDISYRQLKNITDWQLTDDAQRTALAWIVNAISKLTISKHWGDGKTSSSDAHLMAFHEKVLQQGYSPRFKDFALAFYTFVADNYAPFHCQPIECNEGEAPYALDGIVHNESDLDIKEHYTDTRAASVINYTAFEFLGPKFNPRIKGIQRQRIFRIDRNKEYGSLASLLNHKESSIKMSVIHEQWDKMGHFYASISNGHITASVALKRLMALPSKNVFYNANLQLGRILKTENTLQSFINPSMRRSRHRGLLKGEEMHQLARDITYGKRGRITARDLVAQRNCCNCLTIIMACIVYWQAKEIARVLSIYTPSEAIQLNLALLEYISPVGWDNVILYGEYVINKSLIKRKNLFIES